MTETDYINDLKDRLKNTQEENHRLANELTAAQVSVETAVDEKVRALDSLTMMDSDFSILNASFITVNEANARIAKENLIIRSALDQAYGGDAHIDEYIAGELAREASDKAAELDTVKKDVMNVQP